MDAIEELADSTNRIDRHTAVVRSYCIPGQTWPQELCWIYDAFQASRCHVEVGVCCGRSLWVTCCAMQNAVVYAVDPFEYAADPLYREPVEGWTYSVFQATATAIRTANPTIDLRHCRQTSVDAARSLFTSGVRVESVFIDGSHHFADVLADIASWLPLVSAGGMIAGHDYWAETPGVMEAVNQALCGSFRVVENTRLWWYRKE